MGTKTSWRLGSPRRRVVAGLAVALIAGVVVGRQDGGKVTVPVALAQPPCGVPFNCGGDGTASSSIRVAHRYEDPNSHLIYDVEPVSTDTWLVTVRYYSDDLGIACDCNLLHSVQATVEVSWSDGSQTWSATCTAGCNGSTGPIFGVSVCEDGGCGGTPPDHSWGYELVVDIDHTLELSCSGSNKVGHLTVVEYAATDLDDGDVIDSCDHDKTVTPDISGPIGANDSGTFECAYSCASVAGPSIAIDYVDP